MPKRLEDKSNEPLVDCLNAGLPVLWGIGHAPEGGRGFGKFDGNLGRADRGLLHGNDAALEVLATVAILHAEELPGCDQVDKGNQRAMRIDHESLRSFIELRALPGRAVHHHRNVQLDALAAPGLRPSFGSGCFWWCHTAP